MAKKFLGMSIMSILLIFAILFFVFGVGRMEGFANSCSSNTTIDACKKSDNCSWSNGKCNRNTGK